MNAQDFNRRMLAGRRQAGKLEVRIAGQYEQVVRAAAMRAAKAYRDASVVVRAAAEPGQARPTLSEVLNARVLQESARARTAATRKRMVEVAAAEMIDSPPARREANRLLAVITANQSGVQANRLVEGVQDAVSHVILESLTAGWSVPETASQIREVVESIAPWQSTMLARTDLISASNAASMASAQVLGEDAPGYKTWLATSDERTRETHAEADGQTVPLEQPFSVGSSELMYPGDPDGPDDECINCRCTLIYADSPSPLLQHSVEGGILEEEVVTAGAPYECDIMEEGMTASTALTAAEFSSKQRERLADEGQAMPDGSFPIRNTTDLRNAIQALGRAGDPDAVRRHIIKRARALDAIEELPESWGVTAGGKEDEDDNLTAASAPLAPPAEWFGDPQLEGPTPLTVGDDGRVFGHIATWDQCHTGIPGRCVTPPRGLTYDFFNIGSLDTAEGETVKVGKVTVQTGHAPLSASRAQATDHYDNTGSVAAFVKAGEDEFGPWVAGALKSDATPEQIRDMKANGPSGDWRSVRVAGRQMLELVGVLSVPVQGFPIAALSASASGEEEVTALIAGMTQTDMTNEEFEDRLRELGEAALAAAGPIIEPCFPEDEVVAGYDMRVAELTSDAMGDDLVTRNQRFRPAIPAQVEVAEQSRVVEVTVKVDLDSGQLVQPNDEAVEREIGYRVDFFRDHGYWPATPQSGVDLTVDQWQAAQDRAVALVDDPDSEESEVLRARLLNRGFLTA